MLTFFQISPPKHVMGRLEKAHTVAKTLIDCMDVQADLSLCWLHMYYCRFCHALAHNFSASKFHFS